MVINGFESVVVIVVVYLMPSMLFNEVVASPSTDGVLGIRSVLIMT